MKAKLICAMAVVCAAIQLAAMPTEEEAKQAEPVVKNFLRVWYAEQNSAELAEWCAK